MLLYPISFETFITILVNFVTKDKFEDCLEECITEQICGYFEYCYSGDCKNQCKLFPNKDNGVGITKSNGHPDTSCHAVFGDMDLFT